MDSADHGNETEGLDSLYRDVVMDHYRTPRGRGEVASPDVSHEGANPLCGDEVMVAMKFDADRIGRIQVKGRGCSISMASGSMMAELLEGQTVDGARKTAAAFRGLMRGDPWPTGVAQGDLDALEGVRKFPVRVKCAMLPWTTLEEALEAHEKGEVCVGKDHTLAEHATPKPAGVPVTYPVTHEPEAGKDGLPPAPGKEEVMNALRGVRDPEIHQNLVDLGLIYGVDIDEQARRVAVRMTLTTPYCPYGPNMLEDTKNAVLAVPGVKEADVQLVWEPAWDPKTMAADHVKDMLGIWE